MKTEAKLVEPWTAGRRGAWGDEHADECQLYLLLTPSEGEALARGEVPALVRDQAAAMVAFAREADAARPISEEI